MGFDSSSLQFKILDATVTQLTVAYVLTAKCLMLNFIIHLTDILS